MEGLKSNRQGLQDGTPLWLNGAAVVVLPKHAELEVPSSHIHGTCLSPLGYHTTQQEQNNNLNDPFLPGKGE